MRNVADRNGIYPSNKTTVRNLILILILFAKTAVAQQPQIPRDTSFSVYSAFIKERKNYPFIQIAQPAMPKNIESKENMIYSSAGKRDLRADVFYPSRKSKKGYPAGILLFACGWKSGAKSM